MRSGTLNVPAIVGFAKAVQLCLEELPTEMPRLAQLRQQLYDGLLNSEIPRLSQLIQQQYLGPDGAGPGCTLNGPGWDVESYLGELRLPGNLNVCLRGIQGATLMLRSPGLALSSGSACTSAKVVPGSRVLEAIGLENDEYHCSLRFGLGRFNTPEQMTRAVEILAVAARELYRMASPG